MILLFLALVQVIPAGRLHRALGYVQFFLSFVFIGAFFLLSRTTRAIDDVRLEKSNAIYLNPAAWFAAWIEVAEGRATTADMLAAAVAARAAGRGRPARARALLARVCRAPLDDVRGPPGPSWRRGARCRA